MALDHLTAQIRPNQRVQLLVVDAERLEDPAIGGVEALPVGVVLGEMKPHQLAVATGEREHQSRASQQNEQEQAGEEVVDHGVSVGQHTARPGPGPP